jgi:hypothetical protein
LILLNFTPYPLKIARNPYIFVANPDKDNPLEKKRDPALFEKLSTDSELSGILNLLLFRSQAIGKSGEIHKRAGAEMFAEYAEQSSSVATFLDEFCEYVTDGVDFWTSSEPIYESYCKWCGFKVGEVVDIRYFGRQLKKFCGGFEPKRGKTNDRKSTREYKRLNFDRKRCDEVLKALSISISNNVSVMSPLKESQQITMSPLSPSNLWNEIIQKFGNSPSGPKSPILTRVENLMETMETTETSRAGEPVGEEPVGDISETQPEPSETNSIKADLHRAEEQRKAEEARDQQQAAKHSKKTPPTAPVKVHILAQDGYRTQVTDPSNPNRWIDHLFVCGEIAEFQHWKAEDLIKRGIAERLT